MPGRSPSGARFAQVGIASGAYLAWHLLAGDVAKRSGRASGTVDRESSASTSCRSKGKSAECPGVVVGLFDWQGVLDSSRVSLARYVAGSTKM